MTDSYPFAVLECGNTEVLRFCSSFKLLSWQPVIMEARSSEEREQWLQVNWDIYKYKNNTQFYFSALSQMCFVSMYQAILSCGANEGLPVGCGGVLIASFSLLNAVNGDAASSWAKLLGATVRLFGNGACKRFWGLFNSESLIEWVDQMSELPLFIGADACLIYCGRTNADFTCGP